MLQYGRWRDGRDVEGGGEMGGGHFYKAAVKLGMG